MMSIGLFFLLTVSIPFAGSSPVILVASSPSTPPQLLSLFSPENLPLWLPDGFSPLVSRISPNDFALVFSLLLPTAAVFDLTFSTLDTETLAGACAMSEIPHIVLGYVGNKNAHAWSYFVNGEVRQVAEALDAVVQFFSWTRINLISDGNLELSSIAALLRTVPGRVCHTLDFLLADTQSIYRGVSKEMRMSGNRVSVFLTKPEITETVVEAQVAAKIGGVGFGNLLPLSSSLYGMDDGITNWGTGGVVVAEEELAGVESVRGMYRKVLEIVGKAFDMYTGTDGVKKLLDRWFPNRVREGGFVVLNFQSGKRMLVGSIQNSLFTPNSTIYFLGNTTEVPKNAKTPLPISGNLGSRNPNGYSSTSPAYYKGAILAADQIRNWTNILENFNLELFNFTAGTSVWNYDFVYKNVYPVRDKLGLAVLAGSGSTVAINLISLLKGLNYTGPMVGSLNTVNSLSSKKDFPNYVRTIVSDDFVIQVYLQMFKRYGWTNCGLFVSNESWGLGFQRVFSLLASENGIHILNDQQMQILPSALPSMDTLRNYTENFNNFIATKARILILVITNNMYYVLDYLYELGMRAGDLVIVAHEGMSMSTFTTNDTEVNRKRSEIARGSIQFAPASYIGPLGAQVYKDYSARFAIQPPVYACFYYDSVLALAYAFDIIIRAGDDYTSTPVIMKALRGSRFVGCTGTVTIEADTNDRAPMQYNILNAQLGNNDTFVTNITTVAVYDPESTTVFRVVGDVYWCDGTTTVPSDIRQSTIGCPFEDKFNQPFSKGKQLLYGVCAGIAGLTTAFTLFIWRRWWTRPVEPLLVKKEIYLQDVILMAGIAVELVQYVSMAPDLKYVSAAAMWFMKSTTLEIEEMFSYKNGGYELVWMAVTLTVLAWTLMCILVFFRLDYRLECLPCCSYIGDISESLIPFIGNLLFIPIISILLDIFVCVNGVSPSDVPVSFTDSYLDKDCYLMCWQGAHTTYVVLTCFALAVYLPGAVLLRPVWQELQEQLNIHTLPLFLMVKTLVQMSLVILNKTVRMEHEALHAVMYMGVMGLYIAFSIRYPCFGYKRVMVWHVASLLAAFLPALLSLIYVVSNPESYLIFLSLLLFGWFLLVLFGIIYQTMRAPSLLYRKPAVDSTVLFKFAFKRATLDVIASLRDNFKKVGHRNKVVVPGEDSDTERRWVTQDFTAEVAGTHRPTKTAVSRNNAQLE